MAVLQLPDHVTLAQVGALLPLLDAAVADASAGLTIDASAVQVFDTSAVALLLQARRLAETRGLGFDLKAVPAKLAELADLYGVAELLSLSPPSTSTTTPARSVAT